MKSKAIMRGTTAIFFTVAALLIIMLPSATHPHALASGVSACGDLSDYDAGSVGANAGAYLPGTPLVITRAIVNVPGKDLIEGFEIINVSDKEIDLTNYRIFYSDAETEDELFKKPLKDIKTSMTINANGNTSTLLPAQSAYVFTVFKDHYDHGGFVSTSKSGVKTYIENDFMNAYFELTRTKIPSNMRMLFLDRVKNDPYKENEIEYLSDSFNLENSRYIFLCIGMKNSTSACDYICNVIISPEETTGEFVFFPNPMEMTLICDFHQGKYAIGSYSAEERESLSKIMAVIPPSFTEPEPSQSETLPKDTDTAENVTNDPTSADGTLNGSDGNNDGTINNVIFSAAALSVAVCIALGCVIIHRSENKKS